VEGIKLDSKSWNLESIQLSKELSDDDPVKPWHTYGASKAEGEMAAWKFVKEEKPQFVLNTIMPNANFGPVLDKNSISTAGWVTALYENTLSDGLKSVAPQWFVNTRDDALLHLATLLVESCKGERLWAVSTPYNWNDLLACLRELYPDRKFMDDIPNVGRDLSEIDHKRATELLKELTGQEGFVGLKQTVRENIETYLGAEKR